MRIGAAFIGFVTALALAAQWKVSTNLMAGAGPIAVLWRMLAYFTVLSNLTALVLMLNTAITGHISAKTAGVLTVVMITVGLGYHILLAGIWVPTGLAWWADQGLHTAVPILSVMWWAGFAPKAGLTGRDGLEWLVWPIGYAAYALTRGINSGFYPYPFLDLSVLDISRVALNVAGLGAMFVALALLLIGIARIIR